MKTKKNELKCVPQAGNDGSAVKLSCGLFRPATTEEQEVAQEKLGMIGEYNNGYARCGNCNLLGLLQDGIVDEAVYGCPRCYRKSE